MASARVSPLSMSSCRHFPETQFVEVREARYMALAASAGRSTLFVPSAWYPCCHQVSTSQGSQSTRSVRLASPPSEEQSPLNATPGLPAVAVAGSVGPAVTTLNTFGDEYSSTRVPSSSTAHTRIVWDLPSCAAAGREKTKPWLPTKCG